MIAQVWKLERGGMRAGEAGFMVLTLEPVWAMRTYYTKEWQPTGHQSVLYIPLAQKCGIVVFRIV